MEIICLNFTYSKKLNVQKILNKSLEKIQNVKYHM